MKETANSIDWKAGDVVRVTADLPVTEIILPSYLEKYVPEGSVGKIVEVVTGLEHLIVGFKTIDEGVEELESVLVYFSGTTRCSDSRRYTTNLEKLPEFKGELPEMIFTYENLNHNNK